MNLLNAIRRLICLLPLVFAASHAGALVLQTSGTLHDIDADGDLLSDDMKVAQFYFQVSTAGNVVIDLTTDGEFDSLMYLFDMSGPVLLEKNDDESFYTDDSYISRHLDAGNYMVAVGSHLTREFEALQGYMIDLPFIYNRNFSSVASYGQWGLTVITADPAPVPVPPAFLLFATSLLGLVSIARR